MTRKGFAPAMAVVLAALGVGGATAAQAAKTPKPKFAHKATLKSSKKKTQVCVNPTPGFEPMIEGNANTTPLGTSSETGEGFPIGPENCSTYLPNAFAVGKGGKPAGPWAGAIKGGAWVSFTPSGESSFNETGPAYYIYEDDFTVECPSGVGSVLLSGSVMADDAAGVFLNGHSLGTISGNFNGPPEAIADEAPGDLVNGTNKFQIVVYDDGGWTGADFAAKDAWNCAA